MSSLPSSETFIHSAGDSRSKYNNNTTNININNNDIIISHSVNVPQWIPDENVKTCMNCGKLFSVLTRKHHCRQCGCVICSECSKNTAILPHSKSLTPVRICDKCVIKLNQNHITTTNIKNNNNINNKGGNNKQFNNYENIRNSNIRSTNNSFNNLTSFSVSPSSSSNNNNNLNSSGSLYSIQDNNALLSAKLNRISNYNYSISNNGSFSILPSWTYIFGFSPFNNSKYNGEKSLSNKSLSNNNYTHINNHNPNYNYNNIHIPIGYIEVSITGANNLPALDIFGTLDSYVRISLASYSGSNYTNPVSLEADTIEFDGCLLYDSRVAYKSLNPQWNFHRQLNVYSQENILRIVILDHDHLGSDTEIGHVNIPLINMKSGTKVSGSFELLLTTQFQQALQDKIANEQLLNSKPNSNSNSNKTRLYNNNNSNNNNNTNNNGVFEVPKVQIDFTYEYSSAGLFFSQFQPSTEQQLQHQQQQRVKGFHAQVWEDEVKQLINNINYLYKPFYNLYYMLGWNHPIFNIFIMILLLFICYKPLFALLIPLLLICRIIVYIKFSENGSINNDFMMKNNNSYETSNYNNNVNSSNKLSGLSAVLAQQRATSGSLSVETHQYNSISSILFLILTTILSTEGRNEHPVELQHNLQSFNTKFAKISLLLYGKSKFSNVFNTLLFTLLAYLIQLIIL